MGGIGVAGIDGGPVGRVCSTRSTDFRYNNRRLAKTRDDRRLRRSRGVLSRQGFQHRETFFHLFRVILRIEITQKANFLNAIYSLKSFQDARLIFSETTMNKGVGYIAETGIFTTHCPGLYQFSFAGYGSDDLRISLKRKLNKSETWTTLVSAGPRGGANLILTNADAGDQFVVYVDAGKAIEGTTFTGYRFAKK